MGLDNDILMRFQARDEDLQNALTKQEQKIKRLTEELRNFKKESKESTKEAADGFDEIAGNITAAVAGAFSLTAAIRTIAELMEDVRRKSEQAGQRATTAEDSRAAIFGIAESKADAERMLKLAEATRVRHGMDQVASLNLVREAGEANLLDDVDTFAQLRRLGIDPVAGITATQKMAAAFPGRGLTPAQTVNALMAGAAGGIPGGPTDLSRATSIASASGALAGLTPEELLAAVAEVGVPLKSAETGAERVSRLFSKIEELRPKLPKDLQDDRAFDLAFKLDDMVQGGALRIGGKKVETMQDLFGSMEATQGSVLLNQAEDRIRQRVRDIETAIGETGTGRDRLAVASAMRDEDFSLTAAEQLRRSTQTGQLSEERKFATAEQISEAMIIEAGRIRRESGSGELAIALGEKLDRMERMITGADAFVSGTRVVESDFSRELKEAIREFRGASQDLKDAAVQLKGSGRSTLSRPDVETARATGMFQ